jgi:hypothetical protein
VFIGDQPAHHDIGGDAAAPDLEEGMCQ